MDTLSKGTHVLIQHNGAAFIVDHWRNGQLVDFSRYLFTPEDGSVTNIDNGWTEYVPGYHGGTHRSNITRAIVKFCRLHYGTNHIHILVNY